MSIPDAVWGLLLPSVLGMVLLIVWAHHRGRNDLVRRVILGLWAGGFATLAYDIVRIPLAHADLPVFKAISYFGTTILSQARPTIASEVVGWSYHFSNGIGFAVMYTLLVGRPRLVSAVLWGVSLEAAMLVTPYAEVFGYRRSSSFFAITVGAHVVYGLVLWLACTYGVRRLHLGQLPGRIRRVQAGLHFAVWSTTPLLIGLIGADSYQMHATSIPNSPPPYIGQHLYVTWNVPEPDRVGAIWLMQRYVDQRARFHFIEPMSSIGFGTPFDLPEAEIRRYHNRSTFQVLLERTDKASDPAMQRLAEFCYVMEIHPWAVGSQSELLGLVDSYSERLGSCTTLDRCVDEGLAWFDETYETLRSQVLTE